LQSFDVHETGDLVLPTIGRVRARAETYERLETPDVQDAASLSFTFIEDNEDDVDASAFKQPSANANARRLSEQTEFDQESLDNGHFSISDLTEAVSELEGLVNAPFDFAQDVENSARTIGHLAARVTQVFSKLGHRGRDTLLGPKGGRANRKLIQAQEIAARAAAESRRGRPVIVRYVVRLDTSMFEVAAFLRQSLGDLLAINPQIEQPFYVPRGTEIRVFAATGQVR
jgi:prophage DNA circulation protein